VKRRKKNLYFGFGPGKPPSKRERQKSRTAFQAGVKRKRRWFTKAREKEAGTLFKQLQRDAKPQRARRVKMTPRDEELWKQLLKSNPRKFPGDLTDEAISALRKLARRASTMSKKRKKRKKNSRKGKMPAGLKAYWAKKRRAKAKRKNPAKKRRTVKARRKRARRRKPVSLRVRNYRRPVRRKRRKNPPRKRSVKIIKTNLRKGTKAFDQFVREQRAKYGTARVL
jgi:hypothetical protein